MAWARTTDSCGRYIAHALLSVLEEENPWKSCLFASKQQEKTNNENRFTGKFFFLDVVPSKKFILFFILYRPLYGEGGTNFKNVLLQFNLSCLRYGINRVGELGCSCQSLSFWKFQLAFNLTKKNFQNNV